jgi:hypothetical protein
MALSEMREFQSIGVTGRGFTQSKVLTWVSRTPSVRHDSAVKIGFHIFVERVVSHARISATVVDGALEEKKFGYSILATHHFGVRNSTERTISIAKEGVAPFAVAAAISVSVGETWCRREGMVWYLWSW